MTLAELISRASIATPFGRRRYEYRSQKHLDGATTAFLETPKITGRIQHNTVIARSRQI